MGGTIITPFPCRIPWRAVRDWCEASGYGPERSDFLDRCLMAMDGVFVAWVTEVQKQKPG